MKTLRFLQYIVYTVVFAVLVSCAFGMHNDYLLRQKQISVLATSVENSPNAICILDLSGNIVYNNKAYTRLVGSNTSIKSVIGDTNWNSVVSKLNDKGNWVGFAYVSTVSGPMTMKVRLNHATNRELVTLLCYAEKQSQ